METSRLQFSTFSVPIVITALCLSVFWFPLEAKEAALPFEHVLSTNAYNSMITQDQEGFIWFATTEGAIRYDGYQTTAFKAGAEALSSNLVPTIFVDREGLLWIVTLSGLDVYAKSTNTFTHHKHDPQNPQSISSDLFNWAPQLIAEDSAGRVWIATQAGLNSFDKVTQTFTRYLHDPGQSNSLSHNNVWTVCAGRDGAIWIGTEVGLDRLDPATHTFTHYRHASDDPASLGKGIVYAVAEDRDGAIWVGTKEGGLNQLDSAAGTFTHYRHDPADPHSLSHDEVFFILVDQAGDLWLGRSFSVAVGLEKFERATQTFWQYRHDPRKPDTLSGDLVLSCFQDRAGTLWVPENSGPIEKYDPQSRKFTSYAHDANDPGSLGSDTVASMIEDREQTVWLGTFTDGLSRYNRDTDTFASFHHDPADPESLSHNYAFSVLEDPSGFLWVGTDDGMLSMFDPHTGKVLQRFQNAMTPMVARGLLQDQQDPELLWFGTEGMGIFQFHKTTHTFTNYRNDPQNPQSLGNNTVLNLFQTPDGTLWVPTSGSGLDKFDRATATFTHYRHDPQNPGSISGNTVNECLIDSRGVFWVTTDDGGLNKFDPETETFTAYGRERGFPTLAIRGVQEDADGYLWFGTDAGLVKFDPAAEQVVKVYTERDGLQGNQFSIFVNSTLRTRSGELWFAGINGVSRFKSAEITDNPHVPPVVLSSLTPAGPAVDFGMALEKIRNLHLEWPNNSFEFEFTALNYTIPEKNQYAYRLEGFEDDWNNTGTRRYGKYTNIPGGAYTLRIKGSNNDGVWNEDGLAITVTVTPPFWQTWWFRIAVVAAVAAIAAGIVGLRLRAVEAQRKRLQRLVDKRTAELNNSLKTITDSVTYAKRIQNSALPSQDYVKTILPESFVLSLPRDVVGGDVYFAEAFDDGIVVAVMDCTGHGVPGAFMSLLASVILRRIVESGNHDPAAMLQELNRMIKTMLHQHTEFAESDDGLDAAICFVPTAASAANRAVVFAGANLPLIYIQNNVAHYLKGDRQSIGYKRADVDFAFTNRTIPLAAGMACYLFSDGFQDQFGGENGKRFGRRRLQNLLHQIHTDPLDVQRATLLRTFEDYRGNRKPQDDVTVLGFRC